jgi:hypothetical protein
MIILNFQNKSEDNSRNTIKLQTPHLPSPPNSSNLERAKIDVTSDFAPLPSSPILKIEPNQSN